MPIDGGLRDKLEPGTVLVAKYKGTEHTAEVVVDEAGKRLYRLADGREFKSPSAAASAVMGGQAANGWRFWTIQTDTPSPAKAPKIRKGKAGPSLVEAIESEAANEETADD